MPSVEEERTADKKVARERKLVREVLADKIVALVNENLPEADEDTKMYACGAAYKKFKELRDITKD
jgi:hypothetical protein